MRLDNRLGDRKAKARARHRRRMPRGTEKRLEYGPQIRRGDAVARIRHLQHAWCAAPRRTQFDNHVPSLGRVLDGVLHQISHGHGKAATIPAREHRKAFGRPHAQRHVLVGSLGGARVRPGLHEAPEVDFFPVNLSAPGIVPVAEQVGNQQVRLFRLAGSPNDELERLRAYLPCKAVRNGLEQRLDRGDGRLELVRERADKLSVERNFLLHGAFLCLPVTGKSREISLNISSVRGA